MKYYFTVMFQPKELKKVSELMKKLDLDMGQVGIEEKFTFSCPEDHSIEEVKEKIILCFNQCDCEVLKIEGGSIS